MLCSWCFFCNKKPPISRRFHIGYSNFAMSDLINSLIYPCLLDCCSSHFRISSSFLILNFSKICFVFSLSYFIFASESMFFPPCWYKHTPIELIMQELFSNFYNFFILFAYSQFFDILKISSKFYFNTFKPITERGSSPSRLFHLSIWFHYTPPDRGVFYF